MLEITDLAVKNVKNYLNQNNVTDAAVRVTMMSGGCSGPNLGLAIDEIKDNDLTIEQDGVNFVVEKGLSETCGAIKVDFVESDGCGCSGGGFSISSEKPLPNAGGGCGGSCSSGCGC